MILNSLSDIFRGVEEINPESGDRSRFKIKIGENELDYLQENEEDLNLENESES
jgi:hypothetical protein